jgi:hypothetical protein
MGDVYSVDSEKWSKLTIFVQMGNIYSEVGRSIDARRCNDNDKASQALKRAIGLFDATTAALIRKKSPKAKEVLRAKEEYINAIYNEHTTAKEFEDLDRYFLQFAIAARLSK